MVNIDHKFLKIKFSTLETEFYAFFYEKYTGNLDMEPYKTVFITI